MLYSWRTLRTRTVHYAAPSQRCGCFGIVALTLGLMQALPLIMHFQWSAWVVVTLAVLGAGIAHLVLASRLNGREWWAIAVSLALVSAEILFVAFCMLAWVFSVGAIDLVRGKQMGAAGVLAILALVLLLLGRLLTDLFASFESLRHDPPPSWARGFEPIPLAHRVGPVDDETGHGA